MGLFTKRKSRATRRAEARALKSRARLEARLAAKGEQRRFKARQRAEVRALKAQLKAERDHNRTALKAAEADLQAARDGKFLSAARIRRFLTVARTLAPIAAPLVYRGATSVRGLLDQRRADQLGVPLAEVGRFSGPGGRLAARIVGAEKALREVREKKPGDPETQRFATAITERLGQLSAAVTAAENMPGAKRRETHSTIATQLDGIDSDVMARLGVV